MNHTKAFQFCADQYKKDSGSICKLESHLIHDHVNDIEIVMCHAIRIYKKCLENLHQINFNASL